MWIPSRACVHPQAQAMEVPEQQAEGRFSVSKVPTSFLGSLHKDVQIHVYQLCIFLRAACQQPPKSVFKGHQNLFYPD